MRTKRTITVRVCKYCGKRFVTKTKRQYCSRECAAMSKRSNAKDTLCWECEKATGGCSWSDKLIPVEGWEAIPTEVKMTVYSTVNSYKIVNCPLFSSDERGFLK